MRKLLVPGLDALLAFLCWMLAVYARLFWGPQAHTPDLSLYLKFGVAISILVIFIFSRNGLYNEDILRSRSGRPYAVLKANSLVLLSFIMLSYFFASDRVSRFTILIYALVSSFVLPASRMFMVQIRARLPRYFRNWQNIVLVGDGEPLQDYIELIQRVQVDARFVGWADPPAWRSKYEIPKLEENWQKELRPDAFVVSYTHENSAQINAFIRDHHNDVTRLYVLPSFNNYAHLGVHIEDIAGLPVVVLNQPKHRLLDLALKRALDFFGAGVGLLILSPLLLLLAVLVRLSSRGPIFFAQERMGLDGQTFKMWKFRTMKVGGSEPGWTIENDPRRTKIGSFLRSTSMDELPQLWNVFVGDMSLVGPRPEQPYFVESFRKEIPAYMLRHKMRAGITGWAQINGWRGNTSLYKRIEFDLYYIKNWSLSLDIKILFLTFWKGFINKNAY
jgi:exopolysaccharide biosynthesis polyprenyl glycosylphosphotransferase